MNKHNKRRASSRRVKSLADYIRDAAAASGVSVYRIAKETRVDQSTLNKFLTGARNNIRIDIADRLYRFFFHAPRRKKRPVP